MERKLSVRQRSRWILSSSICYVDTNLDFFSMFRFHRTT